MIMATVDIGSFVWSNWWIDGGIIGNTDDGNIGSAWWNDGGIIIVTDGGNIASAWGIDGGRFALRMAKVLLTCVAKST